MKPSYPFVLGTLFTAIVVGGAYSQSPQDRGRPPDQPDKTPWFVRERVVYPHDRLTTIHPFRFGEVFRHPDFAPNSKKVHLFLDANRVPIFRTAFPIQKGTGMRPDFKLEWLVQTASENDREFVVSTALKVGWKPSGEQIVEHVYLATEPKMDAQVVTTTDITKAARWEVFSAQYRKTILALADTSAGQLYLGPTCRLTTQPMWFEDDLDGK